MKIGVNDKHQGSILVLAVLVMAAILLLVTYFLNSIITEYKISQSHNIAEKTYYLTEAGLNEAIWKIKNDSVWNSAFKTNPSWQASISRSNVFENGFNYQVGVKTIELAKAEVTATGTVSLGNSTSRRVIKTTVFQAQGGSATSGVAIFADQNINLSGAVININNNGGAYSRSDLNLYLLSNLTLSGKAEALDQINITFGSNLTAPGGRYSANYPPAPEDTAMPMMDFDSSDPESLYSRASAVYTTGQFNQLMNNSSNIVLNGIIYVTGNANIPRGVKLTVYGALVANGHITMGDQLMPIWKSSPELKIYDPGSGPVGLFSKRKMIIGTFAGTAEINGLIYAEDSFELSAYGLTFSLNGGIITRQITVNSLWQGLNLNYNPDIMARSVSVTQNSPIINIDHWEEEY